MDGPQPQPDAPSRADVNDIIKRKRKVREHKVSHTSFLQAHLLRTFPYILQIPARVYERVSAMLTIEYRHAIRADSARFAATPTSLARPASRDNMPISVPGTLLPNDTILAAHMALSTASAKDHPSR